jgi:iron complex transport system substrate-binding protein
MHRARRVRPRLVHRVLLLATSFLVASACGATVTEPERSGSVTVSDFRGRTMTVPVGTERVVFLVENAMNTFYSVGGAGSIAGIGEIWQPSFKEAFFAGVDEDYATTPRVATRDGAVDLESLAAVRPELVVLWSGEKDDRDTVAIETTLGIPVYGVFLRSFADLTKLTTDMAAILGDPLRGAAVVERIAEEMKRITDISSSIPVEERPTVYWMWGDVFGTAGVVSTAHDLIDAAGGVNVLANWDDDARLGERAVLTLETIVALNPDVIYMWFNSEIDPEDVIAGRQIGGFDFAPWSGLTAVQEGRVFELDDPFLYDFMTGRQPIATLRIAKDINPVAFADVDLAHEYDAFFQDVYGVSYPDFTPTR